jgi:hypothetical protein
MLSIFINNSFGQPRARAEITVENPGQRYAAVPHTGASEPNNLTVSA